MSLPFEGLRAVSLSNRSNRQVERQKVVCVSVEINAPDTLQPRGVLFMTEMSALDREVTPQGKATGVNPWSGFSGTNRKTIGYGYDSGR